MSTSYRQAEAGGDSVPVSVLEYRDIFADALVPPLSRNGGAADGEEPQGPPRVSLREEELEEKLRQAAAEGAQRRERELREEYEQRWESERARITGAIAVFQQERAEYFARVEPELVHLILAVAARILHREAQVDRMLVAALAKVAVENLQQRSHVVLRVAPAVCAAWREYFAAHLSGTKVEVLEDSQMAGDGCVLETELGTADVGIEAQLKEIERGFFDLLATRPEPR